MQQATTVGSLRSKIMLGTRIAVEAGEAGTAEQITDRVEVRANIVPVGTQTYLEGKLLDAGDVVTHRITIRYRELPEAFTVAVRRSYRPDGTYRTETFHILRAGEWEGRNRWLILDARRESVVEQ